MGVRRRDPGGALWWPGVRTEPPLQSARLSKAAGGVDETVERTSDQDDCQNA